MSYDKYILASVLVYYLIIDYLIFNSFMLLFLISFIELNLTWRAVQGPLCNAR